MSAPNPPVFHIEENPEAEILIVAFTGIAAKFNAIRPFDFFQLTGLLRYHRILVRDPWRYCYLKGIDETGFEGLVNRLQSEITRLAPKKVIFIGVSSGGYAALLLGHLLKPDYVHSFSPYTYLNIFQMLKEIGHRNSMLEWLWIVVLINFLPAKYRNYLNLKQVLTNSNGKTQFYLHACARSVDRIRAEHVEDCPRTRVLLYPCDSHNVLWGMIKNKFLFELLQEENLDDTEAVYRQFYADFNPDDPACNVCRKHLKNELATLLKK